MIRHLHHRHRLVVEAWLWLAAQADDIEEKHRCLNAVLRPDPDSEHASLALLILHQRRPSS